MAFRQTLSRSGHKHISTYGTVLDRFLVSNAGAISSSTGASSSDASSSRSAAVASLFEPTKSESTGCWKPPKYSLRRQAKIVKEAALTGQLDLLPDGPKTARIQQRLHRLAKTHAFEQEAAQYQYIPKPSSVPASNAAEAVRPAVLGARVVKPSQRMSREERETAFRAAKEQARDVGPYAGRAKVFKGSRVDKDKARRAEDIKNKLQAMQQTVQDWQSVRSTFPRPIDKYSCAKCERE